MNELSATDKALIVNALLRLVGEEVLTVLEKRDILHEITNLLTGFNITDIVTQTTNRRRLLLKSVEAEDGYTGLPRELVFDPTEKTLTVFGETSADDIIISEAPDIDIETLLEDIDYIIDSGSNSVGWYRKYKSGWVEQGGKTSNFTQTAAGASETKTITLPVLMSDANYNITKTASITATSSGWANRQYISQNVAAASFELLCYNNAAASGLNQFLFLEVSGMAAS